MSALLRARAMRRDLRLIWLDGLAWSLMVGLGETTLPVFALALGLSPLFAGLVATVPMVAGALAQWPSLVLIRRIGSHRRWVVLCAAIQAVSFIPLVVAALHGSMPPWALYVDASLYWAAGLATAPAWNTWVETLIPASARTHYFARRNRFIYVFQIAGLLAAGVVLQAGTGFDRPLAAFAILFAFAGAARTVSSYCLARQSEPMPIPDGMRDVSSRELVARFRHGPDGRLIAYMLSVQLAYQVALPFFTPYLLGALRFSYTETMTLMGALVLAKFVLLPAFAHFAERRGMRALLAAGGIALIPAGALWLVTTRFELLLVAQFLTGAAYAAYELASFLMFFETIEPHERTSVLTTFNVANSSAIFLGSLAGGAILEAFGAGAPAFLWVFAASTCLRIATLPLLRRVR